MIPCIPIPPAGLPSSYTSRSIRYKQYFENIGNDAFDTKPCPRRSICLSLREQLLVKADKVKYNSWAEKWEKDRGIGRFLILKDFVAQCKGMSKFQLEEQFGHASELVFLRIYTFLRWNCRKGCSIALQLRALRIFFDASSGYCYALHFLKTQGTDVLLIFFQMQRDLSVEDMVEVLNTFISLISHGNEAQEYILESKFVDSITSAIPDYQSEELHKLTIMIFAQLAEGNLQRADLFTSAFRAQFIRYSSNLPALRTASHIFRLLFSPELAATCDVKSTIEDFLVLTASSIEVQYEGIAIFLQLLNNSTPIRRGFLFGIIIDLINIGEVTLENSSRTYAQQTFALRLLENVMKEKCQSADALCEIIQRVLPALVKAISTTDNFAGQKASCNVIAALANYHKPVKTYLLNAMPSEWVDQLLNEPHKFCMMLTPTQIDTFQSFEPQSFFFDIKEEAHTKTSSERKVASIPIVQPTIKLRPLHFCCQYNYPKSAR